MSSKRNVSFASPVKTIVTYKTNESSINIEDPFNVPSSTSGVKSPMTSRSKSKSDVLAKSPQRPEASTSKTPTTVAVSPMKSPQKGVSPSKSSTNVDYSASSKSPQKTSSKSLSTTSPSTRFNRRDALSSITTLDQDIYDSESTSESTHLLVEFKDRSFDILPETSLYDDEHVRDIKLDEFYNFNYGGFVKMAKVKKIGTRGECDESFTLISSYITKPSTSAAAAASEDVICCESSKLVSPSGASSIKINKRRTHSQYSIIEAQETSCKKTAAITDEHDEDDYDDSNDDKLLIASLERQLADKSQQLVETTAHLRMAKDQMAQLKGVKDTFKPDEVDLFKRFSFNFINVFATNEEVVKNIRLLNRSNDESRCILSDKYPSVVVNERFKRDLEEKLEKPEISDGSIFRLIVKSLIPKNPFIAGNYEPVASVPDYHRIIEAAQEFVCSSPMRRGFYKMYRSVLGQICCELRSKNSPKQQ